MLVDDGRFLPPTAQTVRMRRSPLPIQLGNEFSVHAARSHNVPESRLRASDLERPFRGVRIARPQVGDTANGPEQRQARELSLTRALGRGLCPGQFLSHRSAAILWGVPLPSRTRPSLHAATIAPQRAPRISGVTGHVFSAGRVVVAEREGIHLTDPASTFALLSDLPLPDLVAAGDFLVRRYRPGYGRWLSRVPPLTTIANLRETVALGRWRGSPRLRRALALVREDSWSPRESITRVTLMLAGLPEPELNVDLTDHHGRFLGCVDLVYRRFRVAIEYQGAHHAYTFAEDLERAEALRAAGWVVIQISSVLSRKPDELVRRVAAALREAGWDGSAA